MKSFCFSYCLQLHQTVFFSRELSSSKMKKNMYSYNKMFKATISGIFAAYIGCHQVKHLTQNMLFNAQSSNFFLMPLTFLQKRETRYIFLKEKWIMGHQSKTIKVWCRNQLFKLVWAESSVELFWSFCLAYVVKNTS